MYESYFFFFTVSYAAVQWLAFYFEKHKRKSFRLMACFTQREGAARDLLRVQEHGGSRLSAHSVVFLTRNFEKHSLSVTACYTRSPLDMDIWWNWHIQQVVGEAAFCFSTPGQRSLRERYVPLKFSPLCVDVPAPVVPCFCRLCLTPKTHVWLCVLGERVSQTCGQ